MKISCFNPVFVDCVPEIMEEGKLYVCINCKVVIHLCPCGCGEKVVLPILPDRWCLTYNGKDISIHPSVGNYYFPCQSHYFIRNNNVVWINDQTDIKQRNKKRGKKRKKKRWFFF